MKRHLFLLTFAVFTLSLMAADLPAGYYDAINGKQDSVLKSTLSQIIYPVDWSKMTQDNNKPNLINEQYNVQPHGLRYKYGTRAVNEVHTHNYTWDGFWYTDTHEDGSVWDMYSPYIHYMAPDTIGAVSIPDLEIEHCFPKGWWGTTDNDAYKDLHHLNPANSRANNNKSDYPPGEPDTLMKADNGIFRMGKNFEYGNFFVFEPCDEYKGDFARAYFYVATAYEQFIWKCDYLDNSSYLEFKPWLQKVLLKWHHLDPVSEKEINRNNRVCDIQQNRNPFIDYPELVDYIWGEMQGQAVDLSQLTFTGSEDYELPIETLISRALPASGIKSTGFTANWKDAGKASYMLDVYTSTTTGSNDTLLNMPYFNSGLIKADTEHFSTTGKYGTTGIGKNSVTFGTNTSPLVITIKGLNIGANSRIVLRAMAPLKLNNTDGSQMKISADGVQIALQALTNDEVYYSFDLPAGTQNIVIEQGNGKNFNVQQLFIITGNLTTTHTSLAGYPKAVTGTSFEVANAMDISTPLYYTITPDGLRTSAPIEVRYSGKDDPTAFDQTEARPSIATKQIRNGQIVIIRNESIYTPMGQMIR